ncbi:hypothetical protein QJS04_geneDACA016708 [Acorus gramineus]|uniref:Uncharacterized protein n=1 Tax=Acorus gramineus TaxID=55184 RepID=A0AAV9ATP9_ACOGR|nr:hypothetical protein QJS04_geneDACA016708 [Acorus gramineus]
MGSLSLEDGSASFSVIPGSHSREHGGVHSMALAIISPSQMKEARSSGGEELVFPRDCSPKVTPGAPYQDSPGCGKVKSIGVLYKDEGERGRMKKFLSRGGNVVLEDKFAEEVQVLEG